LAKTCFQQGKLSILFVKKAMFAPQSKGFPQTGNGEAPIGIALYPAYGVVNCPPQNIPPPALWLDRGRKIEQFLQLSLSMAMNGFFAPSI